MADRRLNLIGRRRRRIQDAYDALGRAISVATGAAELAVERARRAHLDALVELWLREARPAGIRSDPRLAPVLTSPGLADVVRRVEGGSPVAAASEAVLAALSLTVADAAPGAAGDADPGRWLAITGEVDGSDLAALPELWRIGSGRFGGSQSFDVAVPLLDESHLSVVTIPERHEAGVALVETLVMRVLSTIVPGMAAVHVWDVGQLTGPFPALHPLTRTGLLTVHDPGGLDLLLDDLSDRIRRVHNRVLVDGAHSLRELAKNSGERAEPWILAVLVGNGRPLGEEQRTRLQRVARGGVACGVHLVLVNVPMPIGAAIETVQIDAGSVRTSMSGEYVVVEPDPRIDADRVTPACHRIVEAHAARRARIGTFAELIAPDDQHSSASGLAAPIGFVEGRKVDLALTDSSPHALVGGPSGSGKTNLLLAMIAAMASKYPPSELNFYLLDFKEGVSFAQLAPGRRSEGWLPHARLIGININTDREFGLALLQFLADEMRRRAELAKEYEVTKLEELRDHVPMPRIVAVIDEFQYLFTPPDGVTKAAVRLLEDVARRGRSQGIHLVLASQDVSGIEAFWGRPAIFEQFVLRIALPRARRVLDEHNQVALELPRWHAVINHESGLRHGNDIVKIPNASVAGTVDAVQAMLYQRHGNEFPPPKVFDGSRAPSTTDLTGRVERGRVPVALVGQNIDVEGSPATVAMPDAPGRNFGVLGSGLRDAAQVLDAAASSYIEVLGPGARIVVAPLVVDAVEAAEQLVELLEHRPEVVRIEEFANQITELAAEVRRRVEGSPDRRPIVLVGYAVDASDAVLDRAGVDALRTVIHYGPETGVHVLGWWRSVPRLKTLLMMGASVDDIGAWVALDVQGAELQSLLPGPLTSWSPRPGRGLWFDRSRHSAPEVVIVPVRYVGGKPR